MASKQPKNRRSRGRSTVDKRLVAYCGLYCGDCPGYTGVLADTARDLRKVVRQTRFDTFAREFPTREFKHYPECYDCLGAMMKVRCRQICRDRGSNARCKIRKCCLNRGYEGCWECDEFEDCEKLAWLTTVHKDAHVQNLRIIARQGIGALVEGKRSW